MELTEDLRVRPARDDDRRAVGRLLALGFPDKFGPIFGREPERVAAVLADLPPTGRVYVADCRGQVVGTFTLVLEPRPAPPLWPVLRRHLSFGAALQATFLLGFLGSSLPDPATAVVEAVAVLPEWRGRGVGRRMMMEALQQARAAGRRRVALYVVEGNEPAVRLYRSLGFQVVRAQPLWWQRWLFGARRVLYMAAELRLSNGAERPQGG